MTGGREGLEEEEEEETGGTGSGRHPLWTDEAAEAGGRGAGESGRQSPVRLQPRARAPCRLSARGRSSGTQAAWGDGKQPRRANSKPTPRKATCSGKDPPARVDHSESWGGPVHSSLRPACVSRS